MTHRYSYGCLPLRLLLLSPFLLLLLLAPLQPTFGLNLTTGLLEDLGSLPEETCMSIQQLSDAVRLAAWTVPGINNADGTPRRAVIITTCNLACMKVGPFKLLRGAAEGPIWHACIWHAC